jgi:hypothetical protein
VVGGRVGMMRSHDDRIDPHPALRAGLSLPGRGVSLLLRWEQATAFAPGVVESSFLRHQKGLLSRWRVFAAATSRAR